MKKTITYIMAGLALTACSDDKEPNGGTDVVLTDMPIELSAGISGIEVSSRANHDPVEDKTENWCGDWVGEVIPNDITWPFKNVLTQFKLYGYYENGSDFTNAEVVNRTPDGEKGNTVTRNGDRKWYWPLDKSINMYGISPSSYNLQRDNDGKMYMDVTVGQHPNVDIVYATAIGKKYSDGTVNLQFQHALAAIDVYIMNYSENLTIAFDCAEFRHLKRSARMYLPNDLSTDNGGRCSWGTPTGDFGFHNTAPLGDQDSTYLKRAEYIEKTNTPGVYEVRLFCYAPPRSAEDANKGTRPPKIPMFHGKTSLFMLPQTLEGVWTTGDDIDSKPCLTLLGYIYDKRTNNYIWDRNSYLVLPLSGTSTDANGNVKESMKWEAGKRYIYTYSFADKASAYDHGENVGWLSVNEGAAITVGMSVAVKDIEDGSHPHFWID